MQRLELPGEVGLPIQRTTAKCVCARVLEIVEEAKSEARLEEALRALQSKWAAVEFTVRKHADGADAFIISGLDGVHTLLEETTLSLTSMASSPCALISLRAMAVRQGLPDWLSALQAIHWLVLVCACDIAAWCSDVLIMPQFRPRLFGITTASEVHVVLMCRLPCVVAEGARMCLFGRTGVEDA